MKIDIRENIFNNFKGSSKEEFLTCIEDSIRKKEEITLPGLGVLFEALWSKLDNPKKDELLEVLVKYYQN